MAMLTYVVLAVVLCWLPQLALSAPASAEITSIPGLNTKINFRQYGGYINVNQEQDRNLYYWFVESQSKPSSDPLFLWLQGGPGCSSLLGFLTEHGPFQITPDVEVVLNPNTWNTNANIIYLESPAGVGFSYHSPNGSFSTGDNETMSDVYIFLQKWFQLYPEYQSNAFYVSGESYGGHYVPQAAWTILQGNKNATTKINLQGILVGNAWTDDDIDSWSVPTFIYYHHLCSLPTWQEILENCIDNTTDDAFSFYSPLPSLSLIESSAPFFDHIPRKLVGKTVTCQDALDQMYVEVGQYINQYDIYWPCVSAGLGLDCSNYSAEQAFLNSPAVQAAIHAKKPAQPWDVCVSNLNYNQAWPSILPIYPELMDAIHVTVYAGDVTFNVPALGTQIWVEGFNRAVKSDYQAWMVGGQVAGYYKRFDGITYVTVKNSGHMVPTYTPVQGKALLDNYLAGVF